MKYKALVAVFLVIASVAGAAATTAATAAQSEAYSGTHVTFETADSAVVDYSVNGATVLDSVAVQSRQRARQSGDVGVDVGLRAVTNFDAAGLTITTKAETSATVKAGSGATIEAHDNDRGIFVVRANGERHYVRANLSGGSSAEQAGESRVVVTNGDGTRGAFIVVGDGTVTVNRGGNVTAEIGENGRLVYRQYGGERSASEKNQESLIANGTAAAEVYVQQSASDASKTTTDVVSYADDTTVSVTEQSKKRVTMTAERSESEGRVIIASVSEQALESTDDLQVTVDENAAATASSYGDLVAATNGGDSSKFLVRQSSSAQASVDVVVGINHFSKRTVALSSGDGGSDGEPKSPGATDGSGPGFGVLSALAALGAALLARRRA